MLSEFLAALGPFFGCQSGPRLAETLLFVLIAFGVGFCCGGLVVWIGDICKVSVFDLPTSLLPSGRA